MVSQAPSCLLRGQAKHWQQSKIHFIRLNNFREQHHAIQAHLGAAFDLQYFVRARHLLLRLFLLTFSIRLGRRLGNGCYRGVCIRQNRCGGRHGCTNSTMKARGCACPQAMWLACTANGDYLWFEVVQSRSSMVYWQVVETRALHNQQQLQADNQASFLSEDNG